MAGPLDNSMLPQAADHDERFEELAATLAIGSLEPAEAAILHPHLAACARCRRLVADYAAVFQALPLGVDELDASPGLKERLLAEAARDPAGDGTLPPAAPPTPALPQGVGQPRPAPAAFRPPPRAGGLSAFPLAYLLPFAAILLVSFGLGWWNLQLREQLRGQQTRLEQQDRFIAAVASGGQLVALAGTDQAPRATGEVVQSAGGGPLLLVVQGLPDLPPDRVYQVWIIAAGQPTGVGFVRPSAAGPPIVALERSLAGAELVALTIEPAGGSPGPTGPIVLAGKV